MKRNLAFLLSAFTLGWAASAPLAQAAAPSTTARPSHATLAVSKPTGMKSLSCAGKVKVLLLQNNQPWGNNSNEQVLSAIGVGYNSADSGDFATVLAPAHLAKCHTVIVAGAQDSTFYNALAPYMANLTSWALFPQHTLVYHGVDFGEGSFWDFALPLNLTHQYETSPYAEVANPQSPLAHGMPSFFTGSSASHDVLDLGSVGQSKVVLQTGRPTDITSAPTQLDGVAQPVMVDYCYVLGRIIASTTTQEFYFVQGTEWAVTLLWNELWLATKKPGCQPKATPPYPPDYLYINH